MFCPKCKAEYLPHVLRCSDCDMPLVERLPVAHEDPEFESSGEKLKSVWSGEDENYCVSTCEDLKQAAIPFKVIQHRKQFLKGVEEHYEIGVLPKFWEQAKRIADRSCVDFTDEESDQKIMEVPAQDGALDDADANEYRDSGKWSPEDATEEVWSAHNTAQASMIEASLRENYIYYRGDARGDSSRKIFVMPKDKIRAREIVREIENGSPPG